MQNRARNVFARFIANRPVRRAAAILLVATGLGIILGGVVHQVSTGGKRARPFFRPLVGDLLPDYGGVVAVAHNAGDTMASIRQALAHGATVIEVDVVAWGGHLYAGHNPPLPLIGALTFRGPSLEDVWDAAATADAIVVDIKQSSPAIVDMLVDFVNGRPTGPRVILVDGRPAVHRVFRERAPEVVRILGVSPPGRLAALRSDASLLDLIDGVVIRHELLDEASAAWIEERGLLAFAYTVNDLDRVNRLVGLGVEGIITDNLAVMELLAGRRPAGLTQPRSDVDQIAYQDDANLGRHDRNWTISGPATYARRRHHHRRS